MGGGADRAYSRLHRAVEWSALALFLAAALHVVIVAAPVLVPAHAIWLLLVLLLAAVSADFLSGLVHWAADTLGSERTPIVGPMLVRPFREHHADPHAIVGHDFVETNGNSCLFAVPVTATAAVAIPAHAGPLFFACVWAAVTMTLMVATNQIHKWAHTERPPAPVRWLQIAGLLLPPDHHAVHHRSPHRHHYCITTGWLNPVLDAVRFFRAAEWLLRCSWPGRVAPLTGRSRPPGS
jgi:ubiquitin-conjugating enzyme E2 variant